MSLVSVFILSGTLKYIGLRVAAIVSCLLLFAGTLVFILIDGYYAKMIGRGLFGLGEGPLEVVMELIAMRWFESTEDGEEHNPPSLEVAFGVSSASGLAGALVSLNLIPYLIEVVGTSTAYMILAFFPALSVSFAILYAVIDYWAAPIIGFDDEFEEDTPAMEVCRSLSAPCWILFMMGGTLWALLYIVLLYLTDYIAEKWDGQYSNAESARFASVSYGVGLVSSLLAGWVVEKFSKPLIMLLSGCLIFSASCFIISWTNLHPLVSCIAFGLCLGLFEPTLYSCLASVLPEKGSDTAFTWSALIFQVSCFAIPFGFGALHDYLGSYNLVFQICGGVGVLNAVLVLLLWWIAPHLQDVNRVVRTHQHYFRTVVVLQDKRKLLPPRRHSYNGGELNAIHMILKEKRPEEEIGVDPLNSHLHLEEPRLLEFLDTARSPPPQHAAAANKGAFTMPVNYFSKLTEPVMSFVPITTPEKDDEIFVVATGVPEPTDDELRTSFWNNRS